MGTRTRGSRGSCIRDPVIIDGDPARLQNDSGRGGLHHQQGTAYLAGRVGQRAADQSYRDRAPTAVDCVEPDLADVVRVVERLADDLAQVVDRQADVEIE